MMIRYNEEEKEVVTRLGYLFTAFEGWLAFLLRSLTGFLKTRFDPRTLRWDGQEEAEGHRSG